MANLSKRIKECQKEIETLKMEMSLSADAYFQLKKTTKELEVSEERFRRLTENARDVIYRMSLPSGKYEYVSNAASTVFGYSPDEFYKSPLLVKKIINENWKKYFEEEWKKLIKGEVPPTYEYQINHKSGELRWMNQRNILVKDADGKPIALEGIVTDVTGRKKDELKLRDLMELKNNFIKIVSHQFKTPLNVIRWSLDSLLSGEGGTVEKGQEKLIQMAVKADVDILTQIDDLLTVMDIEEKRITLNKTKVQIDSLLRTVFDEFKEKANIRQIRMSIVLPKKNIRSVEVDADMFKEIFRKLIDNAIIYNKEGGRVEAKLFFSKTKMRFELKDTGIGIPKGENKLIYQYFHRASNAYVAKKESTGVGLGIAKYFIEAHQGELGFISEEGKGTTFWFEIPV